MSSEDVLLQVRELETRFHTREGTVHAVNGISFSVRRGEAFSLVGESGSGKSATVLSIARLLPERTASVRAEEILFDGRDLLTLDEKGMDRIRGADIGFIFQDPMASLNPVLTVGRQLTEALEVHRKLPQAQARDDAVELLRAVGIPDPASRLEDYPHELSGGMCQRAMIATALSCNPSLLIADEPTTALDVTIQAQILDLVAELRASRNMAMIWITHDLSVVADLADRVAVMYGGRIVEHGTVEALFEAPQHPYTLGLMASIPGIDGPRVKRLPVIAGQPPDMLAAPEGCPFRERCDHALSRCTSDMPPLVDVGHDHQVACWWDVERDRERDVA